MLQRIGCGFFVSILGILFAAFVEIARKQAPVSNSVVSACDENVYVSEISIFWQIGQFFIAGTSEVLASITALNFFVNQSPAHVRSVILAIYYLTHAFSSWMVGLLIIIVNSDKNNQWITDDLNKGHLELYFLLIAVFMFLCTLLFIRSAKKYKYQDDGVKQIEMMSLITSNDQVKLNNYDNN